MKRLAAIVLALALAVGAFCVPAAAAEPASGTLGALRWNIDIDGILTVSGSGAMDDLNAWSDPPEAWLAYSADITAVVISEGVTSVGEYAFYDCASIGRVVFPESLTEISSHAFNGCAALKAVHIPKNVASVGIGVFERCVSLEEITVDAGNTDYRGDGNCLIHTETRPYIADCIDTEINTLVAGCKNSVIPDGVTSIANSAFSGCTGLESVHIPASVKEISVAFDGCTSLSTITVAEGNPVYRSEGNCVIEKASNTVAVGCKSSVIPAGTTAIGDRAFFDCAGLSSVDIPESVTSIGTGAFYLCVGLSRIDLPAGLLSVGEFAFSSCTGLKSIAVPHGVDSLEYAAFQNCRSLESVDLGSVTGIGRSVFDGCSSLKSLRLPDSVTFVDDSAFKGCTALEAVTVGAGLGSVRSGVFPADTVKLAYVKSADVAEGLVSEYAEGGLISAAKTVVLAEGLTATDYIKQAYPVTGTATVDGEKVNWYKKANRCAVHLYEDDVCAICGQVRGEEEHAHSFTGWESDETAHWHVCTECGDVTDTADHIFDGDVCSVCGYVRKAEDPSKEHVHSYTGWESNKTEHWHECSVCGEKLNAADHIFDGDVCSVCGYTKGSVAILGDANGDGAVNNIDASLVLQYDAGVTSLEDAALAAADVNSDASVNNIDASRILQLDAGVISGL